MNRRGLLRIVGLAVLMLPLVLPKALTPSVDASPIFFLPWRGGQTWRVTSGNCMANHPCGDVWNAYAWDFVPESGATNEVVAVADGTVCYVQNGVPDSTLFQNGHGGNVIVIVHEGTCAEWRNGVYSSYHHLQQGTATVSAGAVVARGTVIARQGNSGYSWGPHLHFNIYSQYGRVTYEGWETVAGRTMAARFADGAVQGDGGIPRAGKSYVSSNTPIAANQPPRTPTQTAPGQNSTLGNRTVTLQWQDAGDPDNSPRTYRDYYAEIWKTDNSWRQALSWTTDTRWTITVPSDSQYAWHVKAGDGALGSDWSSTWNFNVDTNRPPNTPKPISPADGSYVNSRSLALQWQDAGDPDNGPRTYRDYYAEIWKTDSSWQQTLSWTTATNWSVMTPSDGTYQWRVRAGDGAAGSTWSGPWQVVIDTVAPSGTVTINNGVETSDSLYVPIALQAKDIGSEVREVRLSNDGMFWGTWQPMVNQVWRLLYGEHRGTAMIYVQYRDTSGNISSSTSDSIGLNLYPSQPVSSRYRVAQDVVAMNGGVQRSAQYRMNGTSGQSLASGDTATSSRYQVTLGYWNGYTSNH